VRAATVRAMPEPADRIRFTERLRLEPMAQATPRISGGCIRTRRSRNGMVAAGTWTQRIATPPASVRRGGRLASTSGSPMTVGPASWSAAEDCPGGLMRAASGWRLAGRRKASCCRVSDGPAECCRPHRVPTPTRHAPLLAGVPGCPNWRGGRPPKAWPEFVGRDLDDLAGEWQGRQGRDLHGGGAGEGNRTLTASLGSSLGPPRMERSYSSEGTRTDPCCP